MGWIYLINELGTYNYKIGVTNAKDIEKRKKKLQTGNSDELFITREFSTDVPFKLEKMLHRHYAKYNILNEWYELTDELAIDFPNICQKYVKIMEGLSKNPFY